MKTIEDEDKDFIPFGPEWEHYIMTLPKKDIIHLFKESCLGHLQQKAIDDEAHRKEIEELKLENKCLRDSVIKDGAVNADTVIQVIKDKFNLQSQLSARDKLLEEMAPFIKNELYRNEVDYATINKLREIIQSCQSLKASK